MKKVILLQRPLREDDLLGWYNSFLSGWRARPAWHSAPGFFRSGGEGETRLPSSAAKPLREAGRHVPFLLVQCASIASWAKTAVPSPARRSMFAVNSPPAAYICPSPRRISSEQV